MRNLAEFAFTVFALAAVSCNGGGGGEPRDVELELDDTGWALRVPSELVVETQLLGDVSYYCLSRRTGRGSCQRALGDVEIVVAGLLPPPFPQTDSLEDIRAAVPTALDMEDVAESELTDFKAGKAVYVLGEARRGYPEKVAIMKVSGDWILISGRADDPAAADVLRLAESMHAVASPAGTVE